MHEADERAVLEQIRRVEIGRLKDELEQMELKLLGRQAAEASETSDAVAAGKLREARMLLAEAEAVLRAEAAARRQ